jgi:TetR/AcrR family transcriptional repressor of nem operon
MPYSKQHKQETRERILRAASRALRESGIEGVGAGIGQVMAQAGLTHGGFYAHFPRKDALVAAACAEGMAEAGETLFAAAEESGRRSGDAALRHLICGYLSRFHRDHPESGCVLPALAADVARSSDEVRTAFTTGLRGYLDRLEALLPEERDAAPEGVNREDAALALLSGMVGALVLARAVDDPELSDQILVAARTYYTGPFARVVPAHHGDDRAEDHRDAAQDDRRSAESQVTHEMAQGRENAGAAHAK